MRVAALVAYESRSTSVTRTSSDASVCWRRPVPPTLGATAAGNPPIARLGTATLKGTPEAPVPVVCTGARWRAGGLVAVCTSAAAPPFATRPPESVRPCTSAAATATPSAAGSTISASRRDGRGAARRRRAGAASSTRARSSSGARSVVARSWPSSSPRRASSRVRGASPRSSASSRPGAITSVADILDPLFQSSQRTAQARRARGLADPEHARRARPVELEQDAERDHLPLGGRQLPQGLLERAGQPLSEQRLGGRLLVPERVRLLAPPAAGLGPEPVDRDAPCDPAEPGSRRSAARVEAPPAAERLLERLRGEVLRCGAVAGQEDEIAVDRVELLGRDLGEARPGAEHARCVERGRGRVHVPIYGAGAADRHMHGPGCGWPPGPTSCSTGTAVVCRQYEVASARTSTTPDSGRVAPA